MNEKVKINSPVVRSFGIIQVQEQHILQSPVNV